MFASPAFAQAAGGAAPASSLLMQLPFFLAIFAIMYFLLIRPQQKKAKQHQAMVAALRRGDQVVTQGGMIGKVSKVTEGQNEIEVEVAQGVKVRVVKSSISAVISKTDPAA